MTLRICALCVSTTLLQFHESLTTKTGSRPRKWVDARCAVAIEMQINTHRRLLGQQMAVGLHARNYHNDLELIEWLVTCENYFQPS